LTSAAPGRIEGVPRISFLALVYLVIGVIVAYVEDYLENLDRIRRLLAAILAIVIWPLVLLGFDVKVT
jgi:fructose-specific phosphotransferase system IIC component